MKKKALSVLLLCLAAAVIQAGCGGASYDSQKSSYESAGSSFYEEGVYEEPAAAEDVIAVENGFSNEATEEAVANDQEVAVQQRKLIRNVEMTVETEVYEELMQGIENKIDALGGYIEYKDVYHGDLYSRYQGNVRKNAELVVRIPSAKLDEFTVSVGEIGNVTYESESVEDVTLEYVDLESHKKMLQTQQERLLELLEKAETMEDIISLESRLTEVRYQIESMESRLRTIDNQVEYSTVRLSIEEVVQRILEMCR